MLTWNPVLKPSGGGFAPYNRTLGGGPALNSDFEQVIPQQAQRWRASIRLSISTTEQIFALREMVAGLEGRANTILVPAFDRARSPWAIDTKGRELNPRLFRQRSLDGTQFADPANLIDTLITARFKSTALLRAAQVEIEMVQGSLPVAGMYFSVGNRLHVIKSVVAVAGQVVTAKIFPLMRANAAPGTPVNFTSPGCEMRFQSDDQGQDILSALDLFKFGSGTLAFEEVPVS